MKKQKLYHGKPKLSDGWEPLGLTEEVHGTRWFVAIQDTGKDWRGIKVSAYDNPVPFKANYWTSWNGERIADSRDYKTMAEHRPGLAFELEEKIKEAARRGDI
jgi:hypothetical protein